MDPLPGRMISTKWIIGWKVANLVMDNQTNQVAFLPVLNDHLVEPYGVDAQARCNVHPWHVPPYVSDSPRDTCYCGYNAFADRSDATGYFEGKWVDRLYTRSLVILRVALAGSVIEGSHSEFAYWGYRSGRQVVTDVFIPDRCHQCRRRLGVRTEGHLMPISGGPLVDFPGYTHLVPLCHEHAIMSSVSLNEFMMMAGSPPLHWAEDVPRASEIVWTPTKRTLAEYVLSEADRAFLHEVALNMHSSYARAFDDIMEQPASFVAPEEGFGSAILTIPDRYLAAKQHRRRQVDLSPYMPGWQL